MGERGASVIVGAVCAVLWGGLSLWRFAHLQTGMDLVIFHQGLANLAAGRAPLVPIKGDGALIFGDHFHPVILVLVPLLWLWNSPGALLVGQALALGLAAAICTHTAVERLGFRAGTLVGLGLVLSPGVAGAALFDVHEVAVGAPLMALACRAWVRRDWSSVVRWGLAVLLVKEDAGLVTAGLGLALLVRGQRQHGLLLITVAVAWTVAVVKVVIPWFNPAGWTYQSSLHLWGVPSIWCEALLWPGIASITGILLWAAAGLLAHRSALVWAALVPLAVRASVANPAYWSPFYHYNVLVCLVLAFCAVEVLGRGAVQAWRTRIAVAATCVGLLVVLLPRMTLGHPSIDVARRAVACVPDGARVDVDDRLARLLVDRAEVTLAVPGTRLDDQSQPTARAQWLVLDESVSGPRTGWVRRIEDEQLHAWQQVCRQGSVVVWTKATSG